MSVLAQDVADDRDDDAVVAPTACWRRAARWLRRNPVSAAAIVVIGLLVLVAVFAPVLEPYKPDVPDPTAVLKSPSWAHPLGTDGFGRDVLSRIIDATTLDLSIALAATLVALSIGMVVGALSGYRGGWVDLIVLRLVDVLMAFPAFVLAMGITAALGNSIANVAIALVDDAAPRLHTPGARRDAARAYAWNMPRRPSRSAIRHGASPWCISCPTACRRSSCRPLWRWATRC